MYHWCSYSACFSYGHQQQSTTYYDKTADENLWVKRFRSIIHRNSLLACLFHLSHSHRYVHEKYSYKSGIIFGLLLAACGGLLFFPAAMLKEYWAYLCIFFIIATGMCFRNSSQSLCNRFGRSRKCAPSIESSTIIQWAGSFYSRHVSQQTDSEWQPLYPQHPALLFPVAGKVTFKQKQTPWNFLICC